MVLCFDIGGTSIKYGAAREENSQIVFDARWETPTDAKRLRGPGIEQKIVDLIDSLCRQFAPEGIAISTAGMVDHKTGAILYANENIPEYTGRNLKLAVENHFYLPCAVENDVNCAALGEVAYGAGRGADSVLCLTVGTGIGCGALIDGRLYRGYRNRGMEMGHITVKCDGEGCACGGVGCLEHYASTSALVRRFCELNGSARDAEVDGKDVVFFYKEGNPAAVQAMEEHWNYLAHGIASMINLFAPQRVVVGGGISEAGDFYLEKLREGVRRQMMSVCGEETELVAARLGNRAGCMGAAGLVLDKMQGR